jgi:RNA polymerase sigma-70 factor (ECF subfamily)
LGRIAQVTCGAVGSNLPASLLDEVIVPLALSEIDRELLDDCLARKGQSWEKFVDRFMGLVVHVINHTAQCRSIRLTGEDRDDLTGEVFLAVIRDDFAILRRFRGGSSLATYLTVIARRIVVRELLKRKSSARLADNVAAAAAASDPSANGENRIDDREQVERLLEELDGSEERVVRMYHLDGKSYQEISQAIGVPENSIGPTLTRARRKMRLFSAS